MKIKIKNLAGCPEHFKLVCHWMWNEWGKKDGRTVRDIEYRTKHCLGKNKVPMTFVALLGEKPVATVSLWSNDLKSRQDLTPWLSALYVVPNMRSLGIGTLMQQHAISRAKKFGYGKLYLTTNHKNYYEKTNWKFVEWAPWQNGEKTRLYEYKLK